VNFWRSLGVEPSAFTAKLFAMVDVDGSGEMSFSEFVTIQATYCVYNQKDILNFSFDFFDEDGSGAIDLDEVKALLEALNSMDPKWGGTVREVEAALRGDADGLIDFDEFRTLARTFPLLLQPAFELQLVMHAHTLGAKAWTSVMEDLAYAEERLRLGDAQFGKPPKKPLDRVVMERLGLWRPMGRVDVGYINSLRPSLREVDPGDAFDDYKEDGKTAPSATPSATGKENKTAAKNKKKEKANEGGGGEGGRGEGDDDGDAGTVDTRQSAATRRGRAQAKERREAKQGVSQGASEARGRAAAAAPARKGVRFAAAGLAIERGAFDREIKNRRKKKTKLEIDI